MIYNIVFKLVYELCVIVVVCFVVGLVSVDGFGYCYDFGYWVNQGKCSIDYMWCQIIYCVVCFVFGVLCGGYVGVGIEIFGVFVVELCYIVNCVFGNQVVGELCGGCVYIVKVDYVYDVVCIGQCNY